MNAFQTAGQIKRGSTEGAPDLSSHDHNLVHLLHDASGCGRHLGRHMVCGRQWWILWNGL